MDPTEVLTTLTNAMPDPAGLSVGEIVHIPTPDAPVPMVVASINSDGYAYIYDTRTGDRSLSSRNMLGIQLRKMRPDGSRVFTTVKPDITPRVGILLCPLHAHAPNRSHWDEMGFPVCEKDNLISAFHAQRHVQSKHRSEWGAMAHEQQMAREAEEREFRRTLMDGRRK